MAQFHRLVQVNKDQPRRENQNLREMCESEFERYPLEE